MRPGRGAIPVPAAGPCEALALAEGAGLPDAAVEVEEVVGRVPMYSLTGEVVTTPMRASKKRYCALHLREAYV